MDQKTRAALKKDKFVTTTTHGLEWASEHRHSVLVNGAILLAVVLVAVVSAVVYNSRSEAASVAFGAAMQAYQTPLAQPGQAVPPGDDDLSFRCGAGQGRRALSSRPSPTSTG